MNPLERLLDARGTLVLDGGLATALETDGHVLDTDLWSAKLLIDRPAAIQAVHEAWIRAGADIITTGTYQASVAGFGRHGVGAAAAAEAMTRAASLARDARTALGRDGDVLVAASVGPYGAALADGSEYRGDYGVGAGELERFHADRFTLLADSGVDLLAIETIPSVLEAEVLLRILDRHPGRYAWISFTCRDDASISDGTPVEDVAARCASHPGVAGIGVNCVRPEWVPVLVGRLKGTTALPVIAYPNSGERWDSATRSWLSTASSDDLWIDAMTGAVRAGASVIGGCCRTGPDLIRRLRSEVASRD